MNDDCFDHCDFKIQWMMIVFITCNSNLVPLLQGLCNLNPSRFGFSGFWSFCRKISNIQNNQKLSVNIKKNHINFFENYPFYPMLFIPDSDIPVPYF